MKMFSAVAQVPLVISIFGGIQFLTQLSSALSLLCERGMDQRDSEVTSNLSYPVHILKNELSTEVELHFNLIAQVESYRDKTKISGEIYFRLRMKNYFPLFSTICDTYTRGEQM